MTAGELADNERRSRPHHGRNDCRKAASIRKLGVQQRVVFVEFLAKIVGDHFEAGAQLAGVEGDGFFAVNNPVALVPPRAVGIAHDLADVFVKQQRFDGAEEWKDQIETHRVPPRGAARRSSGPRT